VIDGISGERTRKISCFECEPLISKACDRECSEDELELLKEHLKECRECRRTLAEYREISLLMSARLTLITCPPVPSVSRGKPFVMRLLASPSARALVFRTAAAAACVIFFLAGSFVGSTKTRREISENISPVAVATPSMWLSKKTAVDGASESQKAEQPFTDSISQYRAAIGQELRQSDVDWLRVRELVEAMGELRTDLELLTIHMAYLEIRTGNSPYEVAEHWENLSGKAVYK
jgi:hypothetical protein